MRRPWGLQYSGRGKLELRLVALRHRGDLVWGRHRVPKPLHPAPGGLARAPRWGWRGRTDGAKDARVQPPWGGHCHQLTGTAACPQSHFPASTCPQRPAPAPGRLWDGGPASRTGTPLQCQRTARPRPPMRGGCLLPPVYTEGGLDHPTGGSGFPFCPLCPRPLDANPPVAPGCLLGLAAKPSQKRPLPILTRRGCARRFTASTSCSPPGGRKDSGPHSLPSSLFSSPETRTGCGGGDSGVSIGE